MLGESMRRRRRSANAKESLTRWIRWIGAGLVAILVSFGTGYAVAAYVIFPAPEITRDGTIPVPQLVGRSLSDAERELRAVGLTLEETTELTHPTGQPGVVIAQTPVAGQELRSGGGVKVAVSAGRARVTVPDVVGLPADDATRLAQEFGFTVNRREEPGNGPAGVVLRTDPGPGTERELPAAITLFVRHVPPPEASPAGSLPAPGVSGAEMPADS